MLVEFLKDFFWFTYQIINYGDSVSFSFGSRIKKTNLGKQVKIGKSFIYNSKIENTVAVANSSSVINSQLGKKTSISDYCNISNCFLEEQISVYSGCSMTDTYIGRFTYIASHSNFSLAKIGRFCSLGPQLLCGTGEHPIDFVSTHPVFFSKLNQCGVSFTNKNLFEEREKIIIGNDVWIGARVFVKDGVTIGDGAIIGAGSVVVKDVPDYAIMGGVPAKVIKFRFPQEVIQKLQIMEWWNLPEEKLREAQPLIAQKNIQMFISWYESNT